MLGRQPGKIINLQVVDIHGAKFYDIQFVQDAAPQQSRVSRIGIESVYENPQPGDAVTLHLVMGQLTKVEKRETTA